MAPTTLAPVTDVFSVGGTSLTAWQQISACEQVGCTLGRMLSKALAWFAKRASELSSWLWQASGAAYLLEIVLRALKIRAIELAAVFTTSLILLITTRTILWVVRERGKQRRERPRYTPAPRRLSGGIPHFFPFPATSFSSDGFASFRASPSSNYGTCSESNNYAPPTSGTRPCQQFTSPPKPSPPKPSSTTFRKWYHHTQMCLSDKSGLQEFPYPPISPCDKCEDQENDGLPCHHAIIELFRQSPEYSRQWLQRERKRWHPDKFGQCSDTIRRSAENMFKVVQELYALHPAN